MLPPIALVMRGPMLASRCARFKHMLFVPARRKSRFLSVFRSFKLYIDCFNTTVSFSPNFFFFFGKKKKIIDEFRFVIITPQPRDLFTPNLEGGSATQLENFFYTFVALFRCFCCVLLQATALLQQSCENGQQVRS